MKNVFKKALALFLALIMTATVLLSCNNPAAGSSSSSTSSSTSSAPCLHEGGFGAGACTACDMPCPHEVFANGGCAECGAACTAHSYEGGACTLCGYTCAHFSYKNGFCSYCDVACPHNYLKDTCTLCGAKDPDYEPFVLPFNKGLNLSALEGNTVDPSYLFDPFTYENIKSQGFDHVRLPVDFRQFYNNFDRPNRPFWSGNKLNLKSPEEGWALLEQIVDLAEAAGLYILIDFHGWYDLNTSDKAQEDQYFSCITELATRFKDRSDYVVFELINEPHTTEGGNLGASALNALQKKALEIIRETNPTRIVIFAAAEWNGSWMLDQLSLPNDKRIAVAIHTYRTIEFTHQGCTWADPSFTYKVPLTDEVLYEVRKELNWIVQFMQKTDVPVILNEFGLNTSFATPEDITAYLSYITSFCEANGISFTYWEYNQGFGAYKNGQWNEAVLDGLFPNKTQN